MHIHILGICGTFMGSLAQLARAVGHTVTGADVRVYPPMSTQLELAGIELIEGFSADQVKIQPDMFVIGNVVSRGNPLMEAILNAGLPYTSGPQWLSEHILQGRWVLAVAGTHGKTTTASMLAWILEYAGMQPGYLIGGVPGNFPSSARLGESDFFVIEADEYDTAFFDKRSKFVHYRPSTLVLNNLEFDHADIFPDLKAIQRQFHHLVRTVPENGLIIYPQASQALKEVLDMGCWSDRQTTAVESGSADWSALKGSADGARFEVSFAEYSDAVGNVSWQQSGEHNLCNAISAIAAARHVGVLPQISCEALSQFSGVKRRMELLDIVRAVHVYDDFAHHPTAIKTTLEGLRARVGEEKILAIVEPRSNTMREGVHRQQLAASAAAATQCFWYQPSNLSWSLQETLGDIPGALVLYSVNDIVGAAIDYIGQLAEGEALHMVIMSNGSFDGIHQQLLQALKACCQERIN
ncbi:UDP-N-acetylmuramate:L-alanyl-gamma-D-glutamyl-meso-diaminopimelate ligase [Teredinibacter haidensis]|uniref:UDP-N-acetylmuramate:L-alanyl-gamma-D-glutamyl- meso-diaminopimelate ligase n=1 Tax=Teredinibacter haidensis TaxID=2731755 RepID=UPI000948B250|nr:UDP-N-acetylmuramate:L-alanyl-gamma-D-glutamyl-meso-diaminopimelate ligase [Teredinibacter haidensis]